MGVAPGLFPRKAMRFPRERVKHLETGFKLRYGWRHSAMTLLKWALVALVVAVIAGIFGFSGVAEGAATVAKVLVGIFLVLALILGVLGVTVYKKVT